MKKFNLIGNTFGRLTVVGESSIGKGRRWLCMCVCGTESEVAQTSLKNGDTKSCGCLQRQELSKRATTHGLSKTREYATWRGIKNRCYNKSRDDYPRYGGRGITVCDRWINSFESFYCDMGARPSAKHSIDRIDNDGDYSPDNCRWASVAVQARNKRDTIRVKYQGEEITLKEACEKVGIKYGTAYKRLIINRLPVDESLSTHMKVNKYG